MCTPTSIIGPADRPEAQYHSFAAWIDAAQALSAHLVGEVIAGADLGPCDIPSMCCAQSWTIRPYSAADRHNGTVGTGAAGTALVCTDVAVNVTVTGIRWTAGVFITAPASANMPCAGVLLDGCLVPYGGTSRIKQEAGYQFGMNVTLHSNIFCGALPASGVLLEVLTQQYQRALYLMMGGNTLVASGSGATVMSFRATGGSAIVACLNDNIALDLVPPGQTAVCLSQATQGGSLINLSGDYNVDNDAGSNHLPGAHRLSTTALTEFADGGAMTDFHLSPFAVSRASGTDLSSYFTTDAVGVHRPTEAHWARGALEFEEDYAMAVKLGSDAKLYYCTAGIGGTPTWTLLADVKDLTLNIDMSEADVTTRASGGWKLTVGALKDASVEWEMVWDPADTGFSAIRTAFFAGSVIGLAVMDGPVATVGSQGLWADCAILKFDRDEKLEDAITVKVTAKPTYSANAPLWKVVSA